ncbi:hypothetical protein ACFLQV_04135 [Calditrichota bacterium]
MNLMTRTDLDGVVSSVLISTMEKVDRILFADPEDIELHIKKVQKGDILANLPYHHNAGMWFDHHDIAEEGPWKLENIKGSRGKAASTSRLIMEYYESPQLNRFEEAVTAADKLDSARLTVNDITHPKDWILLGFTLDPFMGMKQFTDYANTIIATLKAGASIEKIMELPEVQGRVDLYNRDEKEFRQVVRNCSREEDHLLITDFSKMQEIPIGNRFNAFMMYPDSTVQLILTFNTELNMLRVRAGKNIFNRDPNIHLGKIFSDFGGGGLEGAAGCHFDFEDAETRVAELVAQLKEATA